MHGDTVVFAADGDLWTASTTGGATNPASARRVTAHDGAERYARFSPDGASIAFTGSYDGDSDVYVIPTGGGEPRRLTWAAGEDIVLGWSADAKQVYFRSRRSDPNGSWRLYSVPATGGDATELPLGWAGWLDVDAATGRYAFTRTGFESRTWKRYRGGTADDIWAGDPKTGTYTRLTTFAGQDSFPMWFDGKIYFLSDEGGTGRLWRMDADGKNRTSLTTNADWDVRWPAMGPGGKIVYGLGGDLYQYDIATNQSHKLELDVPNDAELTRTRYTDGMSQLDWFDLSPDGDRLLIGARGELWSVPAKEGVSVPITHDSGARERFASYSADGNSVLYVTDATHEEAIARRDAWGRTAESTVIPAGAKGWHFPPSESPDGAWIAWSDETQALYVAPAKGGAPRFVDRSVGSEIREYSWSPDGRWLAYSKLDNRSYAAVFVFDTKDGSTHAVTPSTLSCYSPAWDPDGRYLYVLGDNHINPLLSAHDFDYATIRPTVPYAILLRPDVKNPFVPMDGLPQTPEQKAEAAEADAKKDKKEKKDKADKKKGKKADADEAETETPAAPVAITFDGIFARMAPFPVVPGSYGNLSATSTGVFWVEVPVMGMAEVADEDQMGPAASIIRFDLETRHDDVFMDGVGGYVLARKGGKMAVIHGFGQLDVVDTAGAPAALGPDTMVNLGDVVITLDPREEWTQIYYEAWRNMRDFYWDPALAGLDWEKMRDQYAKLLPRLADRGELNDLLGELIGELATSHTYVGGGDPGVWPTYVSTGSLGADVSREGDAFKLTRIYAADPADEDVNPLLVPGVGVKEGDYLLAVNHRPFKPGVPLDANLLGLAGRKVILTVNGKNSPDGARDVVVTLRGDDHSLRYHDWVRRNREYVAEKSGGRLGYVHVPDMGGAGLIAFETWFASQLDKDGLVIDCRWNRGGFVSQLLLERLSRQLVGYDRARGGGLSTYPYHVLNGQFVVLTNEFAGSDGDIFPYSVQQLKLAPVIGERSWGGVVGIRGDKPMVDGGFLTQPEFAHWWPGAGWAVENHGVDPDIEVQNLPQDVAAGRDPQLDRAIAELQKELAEHPPVKPDFGPEPKKTRSDFQGK